MVIVIVISGQRAITSTFINDMIVDLCPFPIVSSFDNIHFFKSKTEKINKAFLVHVYFCFLQVTKYIGI